MVTAAELPYDILEGIFDEGITCYMTLGNPRYKGAELWENAVPFLSVCRSWRAVAVSMFYKTAFFGVDDYSIKGSDDIPRGDYFPSCVELIRRNGHQSIVRELSFSCAPCCYPATGLLIALDAFLLDTDDEPDLFALRDRLQSISKTKKLSKKIQTELYSATDAIAAYIKKVFPNVHVLCFENMLTHEIFASLPSKMILAYDGQLTDLYCDMPLYFPDVLEPSGPLNFNYRQYDSSWISDDRQLCKLIRPSLLTIDSHLLKSLDLFITGSEFKWDYFRIDKSTNIVLFNELVSLKIRNRDLHSSIPVLDNKDKLDIQFPKLIAFDTDYKVDPSFLKCLKKSPLEVLSYGFGNQAHFKSLIPLVKKLKRLYLEMNYKDTKKSGDALIKTLNTTFNQAENSEKVVCSICAGGYETKLDFSLVDWPYLTCLVIQAPFEMGDFLTALPTMTHLEYLSMHIDNFIQPVKRRAVKALKQHRRNYPNRFASKVIMIRLEYAEDTFDEDTMELDLEDFYRDKLDDIKWYMPNVKRVDIKMMGFN